MVFSTIQIHRAMIMRTSAQQHSPSKPPPATHHLSGARKREEIESGVRDVASLVRGSGSSAAVNANPFAWLETETTRAHQVSDELLKLTRESAALSNGATKAFEIPTDLLQLARGKREARLAAGLPVSLPAPAAPQATEVPSAATVSATPSTSDAKSSPDILLSDLSDEERAWVEGAETAETKLPRDVVPSLRSLAPLPLETATATASIPWLLVSLWLVAISVFVFS
jgi:hypothetical protein